LIAQCHPPVKVFNFLLQGLVSKNARQRTECLEELGQMIEAIGLNTFNPAVSIKEIAKQISDRDNGVRSAALNTITIAYHIVGEQVYKYTGKVNFFLN
jgi:cytoskeleton-associated protein 5